MEAYMKQTIASIDPGSAGSGIAIWDKELWDKQLKSKEVFIEPIQTYVLMPRDAIIECMEKIILVHNVVYVYIENSVYYANTLKGQTAARSGALVKLSQFIGEIRHLLNRYYIKYELINPQKWKGTLTKRAVKIRIQKRNPNIQASSHALDAVGIGLYMTGVF